MVTFLVLPYAVNAISPHPELGLGDMITNISW